MEQLLNHFVFREEDDRLLILILVASFIIIGMIVIIGVVSCVLLCFEEDIAADVEDQVLWNLVLLYHFITLFFLLLCYFATLLLCFFFTFLFFTPRPADHVLWNLVTSPKLFYVIRNYSDRGISY